jgi:dTDP-4-dehydrorhamnose reductase
VTRALVLGGSGQVGLALQQVTPANTTVIAPSSREIDLRNGEALRAAARHAAADVIINCGAFTRVDDAEKERDDAFAINADAPRVLAEVARETGARLLHVSTDYVFDGTGGPPYRSDALVAPLNVYGASKLAGESGVLDANDNAAVVRTAWVHSGGGVNFIATAVRVLQKGVVMRVVDDQVSTPTRALHLADLLWRLTERRDIRGLLHFTDAGVASWYDVAQCVLEALEARGVAGAGAAVVPVDSAEFPRPALRPRVSLLDKHATWTALGRTPPHWRVGVIASTHELLHA